MTTYSTSCRWIFPTEGASTLS